jgi:hypothetical protein
MIDRPDSDRPLKKAQHGKRAKQFDADLLAAMYDLYKKGKSLTKIERLYGYPRWKVYHLFKRAGLPLRRVGPYRRPEGQIEEMFSLYQSGKSLRELGVLYDRHPATIHYYFKARKYPMRGRGGPNRRRGGTSPRSATEAIG